MEKLILYITLILFCLPNCSENNEITSIHSFRTKKNRLANRSLLVSDSIDNRLLIPGLTTYNQIQNELKNCRSKQGGVICAMVGSFYSEECYYPELGIIYTVLQPSYSANSSNSNVRISHINVLPKSKVYLRSGLKPFEMHINEIIKVYGLCQNTFIRNDMFTLNYSNISFSYNLTKDSLLNYSIYSNN